MNLCSPQFAFGATRLAYWLAAAALFAACATPAISTPEPTSWSSTEVERLAKNLSQAHVEIISSTSWTIDELETLSQTLEELPHVLLPTRSEPLRLARVDRPCLHGIGRYTQNCPTFAEDGTFFLYDIVVHRNIDSSRELMMLEEDDRQDLLRRRALTHALLVRADKKYEWSDTHRWRQINGWDYSGTRAKNRNINGYLRPIGNHSAHLDFVTSSEAFFFRAEDIAMGRDSLPDSFDPDMTFTCQEFTRQRILTDIFDELDPNWRPGTPRDGSLPAPICASFEAWADLENITGVDILFAAERADQPESLFGHLLLHIRHESADLLRREGFEYVYQFGAVADDVDPITYIVEGFTGRFLTIFDLSTFRGIDHTYLQLEQRTLRRYGLRLDEEQTRRLMERIWEVERRFAFPYYFATNNCASMILDLLDPVLKEKDPLPRRLIAMPTEILDILAGVDAFDGEALLQKRPRDVLSSEERAILATSQKHRITALVRKAADSELGALLQGLTGGAPAKRIGKYELLGPLLVQALRDETLEQDDLLLLADSFVEIERANLERARAEMLALRHRALVNHREITADEIFAFRRRIFSHEDLARRAVERNEFAQNRYEIFRDGERRAPTTREENTQEWESIISEAYEAATIVQGQLVDAVRLQDPSFDATSMLEMRRATRRDHQADLDDISLRPSNSGRFRIGIQSPISPRVPALGDANPSLAPVLGLHFAIFDDHLGQRRLHGHRPEVEAVGFAARLRIPLRQEALHNLDVQVTLARYISLATPRGGQGRRLIDALGWGGELEIRARHHALPVSARAFFGVFYPLLLSSSGVDHLAIGLGPLLGSDITPSEQIFSGGIQPYLLARVHLAGSLANVAFLRLRHFEGINFSNFAPHRQTHLRGGFELFIPTGRHGLLISPYIEGELHQYYAEPHVDDRRIWAGFLLEPLRNAR